MPQDSLVEHFRAMARNNAWSNHRLYRACAALSEQDYRAKRVSFFPSLHQTLLHIVEIDWLYLDQLEAVETDRLDSDYDLPVKSFAELQEAQRLMDRRLIAYCDRLTPAILAGRVVIRRSDGPRDDTAEAVLSHLFVHQIHHRGQAHAMLSGTAVPPPQLDEYFLREDAPKRDAELRVLELI